MNRTYRCMECAMMFIVTVVGPLTIKKHVRSFDCDLKNYRVRIKRHLQTYNRNIKEEHCCTQQAVTPAVGA